MWVCGGGCGCGHGESNSVQKFTYVEPDSIISSLFVQSVIAVWSAKQIGGFGEVCVGVVLRSCVCGEVCVCVCVCVEVCVEGGFGYGEVVCVGRCVPLSRCVVFNLTVTVCAWECGCRWVWGGMGVGVGRWV